MKWLTKLERKHIPNFRKNKGYLIAKLIIVAPIAVPLYYIRLGLKYLISLVVIKRKYKPDINARDTIFLHYGRIAIAMASWHSYPCTSNSLNS